MPSTLSIAALLLLLTVTARAGAKHALTFGDDPPVADRETYIDITATVPVEIGDLPTHPKLHWLDTADITDPDSLTHTVRITFLVTTPGLVQFPAIPVTIDATTLLLRPDDKLVQPNPQPPGETRLVVFWNGERQPPAEVYPGQAVEVEMLELVTAEKATGFSDPRLLLEGVGWEVFPDQMGLLPLGDAYFYPFRGGLLGARRFTVARTEIGGVTYRVRRYKARFTPESPGEITGHLFATLDADGESRTHAFPVRIPILQIPPRTDTEGIDTGLVGNWKIGSSLEPATPTANEPITITLDLEGNGEPELLKELDFSTPGFTSLESDLAESDGSTFDRWKARFTQTLVPTGEVATLPAITLTSFDTIQKTWVDHPVTPALPVAGAIGNITIHSPATTLGRLVQRPVLLNLPPLTFALIALAPLLPLLVFLIKRQLARRDPTRASNRKALRDILLRLRAGEDTPDIIDDQILPLLRSHFTLSSGTSTGEIAELLEEKNHPQLAAELRTHARDSFTEKRQPYDPQSLATNLSRITLTLAFLLVAKPASATSLEEANATYASGGYRSAATLYQSLADQNPGSAALHLNLAKAQLAARRPAHARAACHTALLLDPRDRDARALMDEILAALGQPALPGSRLLALRPDQLLFRAALVWAAAFIIIALPRVPRWPAYLAIAAALFLAATAVWRQTGAYATDQFMVLARELPRQPQPGTVSWDFPPLESGQIIRVAAKNGAATHARVASSGGSFWLPLDQLQQIW